MGQSVDIESVLLSEEATTAWQVLVDKIDLALGALRMVGRNVDPATVHVTGEVEDDGTLCLTISVPGTMDADMPIPPEHWEFRK